MSRRQALLSVVTFCMAVLCQAQEAPDLHTPVVAPLLETHWNQESPYNASCPMWFSKPTMVGCVPLAMAQIMRYHRWPVVGKDSITYYCKELMRDLSVNFSKARYDYDKMPEELNSQSREEEISQVSKFLYDCGLALQAEFWTTETSALTSHVDEALVKYFRYDEDIKVLYRQSDTAHWEAVIRQELDEGRPVYYSGKGTNGGHAFVCDGYDSNGMFHFNFGWGGKYDGYYWLSHIGNDKINYSDKQQILYNIKPNQEIVDIPAVDYHSNHKDDDVIYDIAGRPVGNKSLVKGIYILNGRKFLR